MGAVALMLDPSPPPGFVLDDGPSPDVPMTHDGRMIVDVPGPGKLPTTAAAAPVTEGEQKDWAEATPSPPPGFVLDAAPAGGPPAEHTAVAPPPKPMTAMQSLGAGTREVIEGAGSLLDLPGDVTRAGLHAVGVDVAPFSIAKAIPDALGLPEPQTDNEKVVGSVVRGAAGALPFVASGGVAAAAPVAQLVGGGASSGVGEKMRQEGYGPLAQFGGSMLAGGLAGGASAAGGLRAKVAPYVPAGDNMAAIAKRLGIKPSPATVGGRFAAGAQVGLTNAPGSAGPVRAVIEGENEGLAEAAKKTAGQLGNVSTPQGAGDSQAKGAKAWLKATGRAGGKLYDKRDELLGGKQAPIVMGNTGNALANFAAGSPSSPVLAQLLEHPKLRRLREGLAGQEELTVGDVTGPDGLLSHVRTVTRNAHKSSTITGATEHQLRKLKDAILADVNNAAEASDAIAGRSGPGSAKAAQREGDKFWQDRATAKESEMKLPLASAENPVNVSGERVYRQMFNDMKEEGGNIVRLRSTLARMPTNQRRTFSATAFDDLGKAKPSSQNAEGDAWSFETFGTNWGAMSKEARALVFGGKGVDQQISDIVKYTERLKQLNKDYNFSRTAPALLRGGSILTAMTALVTGTMMGGIGGGMEAAAGVGALHGSLNVLGRSFVSKPAMRLWTKNALAATAKGNEAQLRTLLGRLPAMAKSDPEARADIVRFQVALNSALASRGAANDVGSLGGLNAPLGSLPAAASGPDTKENKKK